MLFYKYIICSVCLSECLICIICDLKFLNNNQEELQLSLGLLKKFGLIQLLNQNKNIQQSAKKFDLLGLEINFQINGLRTYNTFPGLVFTIILISFFLYSFVQMVDDIQNGTNPVTQKTSQYLQQNEGFSFPAWSFVFVVYIGDSYGQFIKNTPEKTYYTIQFRKIMPEYYNVYEYIQFGSCNDTIIDQFKDYGATFPISEVSCLKDEEMAKDGVINLRNSFHLKNFTKYSFEINKCTNSSAEYVCASEEEIDQLLENGQVLYSFPQYEFNALNFTHPYQIKLGVRSFTINTKNAKMMNLVYKQSQSFTELNAFYFFPTQRLDQGIEYFETYLDLQSGTPDGYLGGVQLYLDDMKFVYHRTYQNILNIFGALGGTYALLKQLLIFILKPFHKLSFVTSMFNKISGKQKKFEIIDYFTSKQSRVTLLEYYDIIQKAIELESYMETMLKYENELLTFRSDKLAIQNADLMKSQRMIQIGRLPKEKLDSLGAEIDQLNIVQQNSMQQIQSPKQATYRSEDYIVNNER
ncbi:hypothetical protein pb186bvf_010873 [Paramecium bursaria]